MNIFPLPYGINIIMRSSITDSDINNDENNDNDEDIEDENTVN